MIISLYAEKSFDKIQYSFKIKVLERLEIQGTYPNLIKMNYSKNVAHMNFNGEKLKPFSVKSGTGQGCALLPCLFNIVLMKFLARAIKQLINKTKQNKIKQHIVREEVKVSLFVDDMIIYISFSTVV